MVGSPCKSVLLLLCVLFATVAGQAKGHFCSRVCQNGRPCGDACIPGNRECKTIHGSACWAPEKCKPVSQSDLCVPLPPPFLPVHLPERRLKVKQGKLIRCVRTDPPTSGSSFHHPAHLLSPPSTPPFNTQHTSFPVSHGRSAARAKRVAMAALRLATPAIRFTVRPATLCPINHQGTRKTRCESPV